jgi:hypothetical protein
MLTGNIYVYFISKYFSIKLGMANLETDFGVEEFLDSSAKTD